MAAVRSAAQGQPQSGIEVAQGFVLESMFPQLFGPGEVPVDLGFDADGVPFVLVEKGADGARVILRIDDPGGWGHGTRFHVVASAAPGEPLDVAALGIALDPGTETATRTWDGEEFQLGPSRVLFDVLLPEVPLLRSVDAALVIESDRWPGLDPGALAQLLVADTEAQALRLFVATERGREIVLGTAKELVWVSAKSRFRPKDLVAGPDGQVWITDPGTPALWRLRPAGSSTHLGPVLAAAHGPELLMALRDANGERRDVARELILSKGVPVHGQDRALALLDALQQGQPPFATASLDLILARRGKPLPRSEPVLDGGLRERLERHQVRLDGMRAQPLAARRLLPRWLECSPRTRLAVARILSAHPAATQEEQDLARAALGMPQSTTRYVVLADPPGSFECEAEDEPAQRFGDGLNPLGVEYVEILTALEDLLPRLSEAHTIVLASIRTIYSPLVRSLLESFVERGGGLFIATGLDPDGNPSEPERASSQEWLRRMASCPLGPAPIFTGGNAHFVDPPEPLAEVASSSGKLPFTRAFQQPSQTSPNLRVLIEGANQAPVIAYRNLGRGRVVTSAVIPWSNKRLIDDRLRAGNEVLRAVIVFAGTGKD